MKELDVLLAGWLDSCWRGADDAKRRDFAWLLEQPDPDLADWLIGGVRPGDRARAALVDEIVRRPA
jgi:succinate dehydrogenase flavin-adding protein (antitoxin of CptAB toxin-antitoxin module)